MPLIRSPLFKLVDSLSRAQKKLLLALIDVVLAPVAFLIASTVLYNALPNTAFFERYWVALIVLAGLAGSAYSDVWAGSVALDGWDAPDGWDALRVSGVLLG